MITLLLLCLLCGAGGAYVVSRYGQAFGFIDTPNFRSSHSIPTPKGGGIGILLSFLVVCLSTGQGISFWLSAALLSLSSMYGDRQELAPLVRLCIQFSAACIVIFSTIFPYDFSFGAYLLVPLWIIFLVGTANFYNFMDGINGIAGLTGMVAFGLLSFFLFHDGSNPMLVTVSAGLACSCLGFLPFNMPRARVFMGDSGSILLGFVFAVCVFFSSSTLLDFLCYASLLFPFYIDELSTMTIRLKNGERLSQPHRKHLYQLLANEKGIAHWKVASLFALLQFTVGISVFVLKSSGTVVVLLFLFLLSLAFVTFSYNVRKSA